jgi:DNA repair exonuclease SbcCD nuclease subunit
VKILHTADFHLKAYEDDRWKSLQRLIEIGKKQRVKLLVVSGDLFNKGIDAENLRPRIREIFSNTGSKIVIIPGNHDAQAYDRGIWFGEDVVVLTDLNRPFEHQGVKIWGMPFESIDGEEILEKLRSLSHRLTENEQNILLFHGELLDAFFSRRDFGDEGEERYMPVKLSYFKDSRIDYVLAGHFHSQMNYWRLKNGGYFVYPGSPVSITKREIGRRKVNIFDVGKPPQEYLLDTPHFEEIVIECNPFRDKNPLEMVQERFIDLREEAKIILAVKGFIDGKANVLEDEMVKRFMQKLGQAGCEEGQKKRIRDIVIHAIIQSIR